MGNSSQLVTVLPTAIAGIGGMILAMSQRGGEKRHAFFAGIWLILALLFLIINQNYFVALQGSSNSILGVGFLSDPFTWFFSILILAGTIVTVVLSYGQLEILGIKATPEFYGLLLMTTASAIVLVGAGEMTTLFVGLEALSIGLYCLCGSATNSRRSVESALKYFILGSFSSAFLLYGMAIIYGTTGTLSLSEISSKLPESSHLVASVGIGLTLIGVYFKLGAVPFHFWTPDVYQGAPAPVTAYMASVVKMSALAVAIRILWTTFGNPVLFSWWIGFAWTVSALTMIVGNVVAVRQRNVKRMLAYSSMAHVGYMTAALIAPSNQFGGGTALLYYIVIYSVVTIGTFAVTMIVTGDRTDNPEADDISLFTGLSYNHPRLAAIMTLFLLTLAGLPPGIVGLVGKFYLLSSIVQKGFIGLSIIAGLCSVISCFYYLRVIVAMYFQTPATELNLNKPVSFSIKMVIVSMAMISLLIGIFPNYLYSRVAVVLNSVIPEAP